MSHASEFNRAVRYISLLHVLGFVAISVALFPTVVNSSDTRLSETQLRNLFSPHELIRSGAEGNSRAQVDLGRSFLTQEDFDAANFWFELAAIQREPAAFFYVAYMHEMGLGYEQDFNNAAEFYKKAVAQNHGRAQYRLGRLYRNGYGVEENASLAAYYYRMAAIQGISEAQGNYGAVLANGYGVPVNDGQAFYWSLVAAKQGEKAAMSNAKEIRSRLSRQERRKIEAKVAECEARSFTNC